MSEENNGEQKGDFAASVCAIVQRKNSMRRPSRKKRRGSSTLNPDVDPIRRRSSAVTISSGE